MKPGILLAVAAANAVALFCAFNPWFAEWAGQATVFLVVEAAALALIGVPVFVHHLRKGLPPRQALSASLDTVMTFMSGWV